MKLKVLTTATLLTATAGLSLALANNDPAAPPPQPDPLAVAPADPAVAQPEQQAFLGVHVTPVDFDTAEVLGIARGTGLFIESVAPDSPAAAAGLKAGDVLTRLNDQVLINAEQFAVLIRLNKAGDQVALHALREGEPVKLKAQLAGRDLPALGPGGAQPVDPALRDPIGSPFKRGVEVFPGLFLGEGANLDLDQEVFPGMPEDIRQMIEQMHEQMNRRHAEMQQLMQQMRMQDFPDIKLDPGVAGMMSWSDGEHTIRVETKGDSRHLTVTTREGEVLFDGEVPEDGQVEGLPKHVQDKVDRVLKNNRIELRIQPAPRAEPKPADPALIT